MNKKKQQKSNTSMMRRFVQLPADKKRRLVIKSVVSLSVLGVAAGALSDYDKKNRELHDLTVIGTGKPVVVQVHDTSCPICRNLKSRVTSVLKGQDKIEYRIADITTNAGRKFQNEYGAQKTTLLLFNGEGRHINTVVGLQSVEELERIFARHVEFAARQMPAKELELRVEV